ncbi:MAG TPA: ribonuclease H [Candidatus Binatia bacterium]
MTDPTDVIAFTDGAAKGNPGPGGWGAVLLVGGAAVRELGGAGGRTTNNRMEVLAAISALQWCAEAGAADTARITIVTDSSYLLRGVREWLTKWKARNWKTLEGSDVANRDLWERLDLLVAACPKVSWRYVPGHAGVPGNERADEIASAFATAATPRLYSGPYSGYDFDLGSIPDANAPIRAASKKSATKGSKAYSYVSMVDGVVATHRTWAECEQRVKGRSRARYRKTASAAEEKALVAEWDAAAR